jgi:hypothetical protein
MRYKSDGSEIGVGDQVIVEGNVLGVVVCDFDRWRSLPGYDSFLSKEKLADGTSLSSGIMVETKELGMIHYADEDVDIVRNPNAS